MARPKGSKNIVKKTAAVPAEKNVTEAVLSPTFETIPVPKRKRGRPPKNSNYVSRQVNMLQTNEQKSIFAALLEYVESTNKTFASVAREMHVTQNSISNWKKGYSISVRNQQRILKYLGKSEIKKGCDVQSCTCRDCKNPVLGSFLRILGELPEKDIARLYVYALELKDSDSRPGKDNQIMTAAEEPAPYNC